jgi:hypothetical protein
MADKNKDEHGCDGEYGYFQRADDWPDNVLYERVYQNLLTCWFP